MEAKRYIPNVAKPLGNYLGMAETPEGAWVRCEDYAALEADVERLTAERNADRGLLDEVVALQKRCYGDATQTHLDMIDMASAILARRKKGADHAGG